MCGKHRLTVLERFALQCKLHTLTCFIHLLEIGFKFVIQVGVSLRKQRIDSSNRSLFHDDVTSHFLKDDVIRLLLV